MLREVALSIPLLVMTSVSPLGCSSDSPESSCSFLMLLVSLEAVRIFKLAGKTIFSVPRAFAALAFAISRSSLFSFSLKCRGDLLRDLVRDLLLQLL